MSYLNRWRLLVGLVVVLFFIEYSPLVIPPGEYKPMVFGIPFSLWLGTIFTIIVVALTYVGSKVYSKVIEEEGD